MKPDKWYKILMTSHEQTPVVNGRLVRPGFYRSPDGAGLTYAKTVASGSLDTECIFCPEGLEARKVNVVERIGSTAFQFYIIEASPAYAHFDAQKVVGHRMLIPEAHIEEEDDIPNSAYGELREYIREQRRSIAPGVVLQHYTRAADSPSKSIGHLHTHLLELSLDPVRRFEFDSRRGVTALEFAELTPEQAAEVIESRR